VATGPTTQAEDRALLRAVAAYEHRSNPEDFGSLTRFLSVHPHSPWRTALLTDLGLSYLHYGYFSRAIEAWQEAWNAGKNATEPHAKALVDRAVGELVLLRAELGHVERLDTLLGEIADRPVSGPATEAVQIARETLWVVTRQAIGTPDRHGKGTPSGHWVRLVPVANRRVPRASRSALTSDGAARVGGACLPTGASRGGTQARCLKRQLSLPVSMISQ
jgi:hypothetical protein